MAVYQIGDLSTIPQAPADADVLAIEVNGVTYKVSKSVLAAAILAQLGGDPVTVAHGGTGATTAAAARTNLSVPSTSEMEDAIQQSTAPSVNAVAPFGQWTSYTGGYYLVGKIVFVQVTAVAGNFGANDYFTMASLPAPAYQTALAITTTSDNLKGAEAYVDATGKLLVKSGSIALTGQRVVVTGCYIKQ